MKFIAIKQNIKEALSIIERATGDNLNLPILKNTLIETNKTGIRFTSTDLEMVISCLVTGKVIEEGAVTIPVGPLSSLINNLQSDRLNFDKKGNGLEIKTDNYNAVLQGLPPEDFPGGLKMENGNLGLEIKGEVIKESMQRVIVASQFSELRPELNSVFFNFSIDNLKLAATDGFRLTESTISQNQFTSKQSEPFSFLLPLKAAIELSRMVKDDDTVAISYNDNQASFKTEHAELISRLIEGSFPDYSGIIPKKFSTEILIDREELANAIKLAGIFGQKNGEVKISVQPNKKIIEVSSADQSLGDNTYIISAKIKGEAAETYFNLRYLADSMKAWRDGEIFIGLQEETNPALLRSSGDASYFYVLKPILKS